MTDAAPGTVTTIVPDARRSASVRVTTSAGTVYTVPADRLPALGIVEGRTLDAALASRLADAADEEASLRAGLSSLRRRPFARHDLGRRLRRRGHPAPAVDRALGRLEAMGLLDDRQFAMDFVQTRATRGRGPARLKRDLLTLGVEGKLIDAALRQHWPSGEPGADVPHALASTRARQLGPLPLQTKRRRLLAFLARRGFTGPGARDAVRQVLAAERRSA